MNSKNTTVGLICVLSYVFLSAAREIYFSHLIKLFPLSILIFLTFSICIFVFLLFQNRASTKSLLKKLRSNYIDFIKINITTAAMWILFLLALQWIQPAAAASINGAMGPIFNVIFATSMLGGQQIFLSDKFSTLGILISVGLIVGSLLKEGFGFGQTGAINVATGVAFTVMSGNITAINNIYLKRLSNAGLSPKEIMSIRFWFLTISSGLYVVFISKNLYISLEVTFVKQIVVAVLLGIILPLYLLQVGIQKLSINTVSLLLVLGPSLTLLLQYIFYKNYIPFSILLGIIGVGASVTFGIFARIKREQQRLLQ